MRERGRKEIKIRKDRGKEERNATSNKIGRKLSIIMKIVGAMATGICVCLVSGVFDIHTVLETEIFRYKENDPLWLGPLERIFPSHWTNFLNTGEYQI
jgi:hypothetical protein